MLLKSEEIAAIFQENYSGLCRFLESIVGRGRNAGDLAQESFVRLCEAELAGVPATEIRFWLFRVARNLALNEIGKDKMRPGLFDKITQFFSRAEPSPEDLLLKSESRRIVRELLDRLPEHQRSALLLREGEEMSYREIALVLGASESKIKVDIFRARRSLRKMWFEREGEN